MLPSNCRKLVFKYSRLFCDVEKFKDNSKEIMTKKGMGVIYTKDYNDVVITIPKKYHNTNVIKSFYNKHHNKLNKRVTEIIKKHNKCIIVDFHGYSDTIIKKIFNASDSPDICIDTNSFYTDDILINLTIDHFKKYGYSIEINKPYSGTIIPNKYLNKKDQNLQSIMLEINKRCYLNNKNEFLKFKKIANKCLLFYFKMI